MKLVVQRVKEAGVKVDGKTIGKIGKGLFVLLGVGIEDKPEYADILAAKLVNMRIIQDEGGKMNLSVRDVDGEVLVVSQFTLYADTSAGRRPSFVKAANPTLAKDLYERFVKKVEEKGVQVATGSFGDFMEIRSTADGPVTIVLEYPERK
ncbi:MAG: D-aminoacyl-tRNA deacylase [bacterium]|nr:D-aminoacyl-tRNA deacylase [bacterium]